MSDSLYREIARSYWRFLVLAAFVVILKAPYFNNPAIHIDEQFYLAVADKWLRNGLIPYVDVWDRKPIGIFAIYGVAIKLFGNAILGYQILGTLSVIATGGLILCLGRWLQDEQTGFFAAMIYAVGTMLMEGSGGQTPVFYNLLLVGGVAIILRILIQNPAPSRGRIVFHTLGACSLFGLALQVKYTCVVEISAISILFLGVLYHRRVMSFIEIAALACGMAICGLLPTLAVGAIYASIGHWHEFYSANFESIFAKLLWRLPVTQYALRFIGSSACCMFFLPFAAYSLWIAAIRRQGVSLLQWGLIVWLLASFIGAVMLGNPTRHYFLPTLPPLALLTSFGFLRFVERDGVLGRKLAAAQHRFWGHGGMAAVLAVPTLASFIMAETNALQRGESGDIYAIGAYIKEHHGNGCLFVFNRLPILYYLGDVCAPSLYMFPNHLSEIGEVRTPSGERLKELARVLSAKPAMIFIRRPHTKDIDGEAIDMVEQAIHDNYVLAMERPGFDQLYSIYELKRSDQPSGASGDAVPE